jgi:serine protease Do
MNEKQNPEQDNQLPSDEMNHETPREDGQLLDIDAAQVNVSGLEDSEPEEAVDAMQNDANEPQEKIVYRWSYAEQQVADAAANAQRKRQGTRNYAIVMTVCFAISFLILIATLIGGWQGAIFSSTGTGGYREIFIRDEIDSDALTMQEISAAGNRVVVAISVKTEKGGGVGTGIVMTEDGYIITNSHVVNGATEIVVQMYDGAKYRAELIGESEIDDLAIIKIEARGLETAKFGSSSNALVGDRVVVIGHPAGMEFGWTSTFGRLSAINRDVKIRETDGTLIKKMTLIQTDANVNSGNSGGPMFNDRGEVIGIITLKLAGDYEGLGFAIPIDTAMPLLTALKETGTTDGVQSGVSSARPQLGIMGGVVVQGSYYVVTSAGIPEITKEQAAVTEGSFCAEVTGWMVMEVQENVDAYGKILVNDIITAVDGVAVTKNEDLREYLYDCNVGDTVTLEYVRDGQKGSVRVVLGAGN